MKKYTEIQQQHLLEMFLIENFVFARKPINMKEVYVILNRLDMPYNGMVSGVMGKIINRPNLPWR